MKRRSFLKFSSALSLPVFIGSVPVRAIARSSLFNFINGDSDKILVLVQLNGGNDGLNTVVPLDQYDQLANARTNLIIPEGELLEIDLNNGLHPVMTGVKSMYDDGMVSIIQGIGYPNQNRSHFRSTDIWMTGSAADTYLSSGWAGRYLDDTFPGYPENYPNEDCPDPIALTMGSLVSETCQGLATNFSLAVNDIDNVATVEDFGGGSLPDNCYGEELGFIRQTIEQTNAYAEVITRAAESGANSVDYPETPFAEKLKSVARLIAGGLRTRIYVVSLGGFDTHALQVEGNNSATGTHANLLETISSGLHAFHNDLKNMDHGKRVISMTFSEFGRQIRSNDSLGTDHGTAAPMFVFGECIVPGILGTNPEIPDEVRPQDGVPMQFDFRSLYGTVLEDWFGVPEQKVRELLFPEYQKLPILSDCGVTSTNDPAAGSDAELKVFPNPFTSETTLSFRSSGGMHRISIFDIYGREVLVLSNNAYPDGPHELTIDTAGLPAGNYYLRITDRNGHRSTALQKLR